MISRYFTVFLCLSFLISTSCSKNVSSIDELNTWLNESSNGCLVTKHVEGFVFNVKFIPPSYLVLRELNSFKKISASQDTITALLQKYKKVNTFILTISPDKNALTKREHNSVMYDGVSNYREYVDRVLAVNFFMDERLRIFDGEEYQNPLYSNVENLYELSDSRNFMIAFPKSGEDNVEEYTLIYDDQLFGLGSLQFSFKISDLIKAQEIKINI